MRAPAAVRNDFTGFTPRGLYKELRFPIATRNVVITSVTETASIIRRPVTGKRSKTQTSATVLISSKTKNAAARFFPTRTVEIFKGTRKYTWAALRSNPKTFQNNVSLNSKSAYTLTNVR